jgi:hypothetical protein
MSTHLTQNENHLIVADDLEVRYGLGYRMRMVQNAYWR